MHNKDICYQIMLVILMLERRSHMKRTESMQSSLNKSFKYSRYSNILLSYRDKNLELCCIMFLLVCLKLGTFNSKWKNSI